MCGKTSYFHWTWAIRSSRRSNSSGERVVQKRAILRAISRRAAAIASNFRRSFIELDRRSIKIGPSLQELSRRNRLSWRRKKLALQTFLRIDRRSYRSLIRIALEARILFCPAMHLAAGRTLHRIHLLDRRGLKCLRIHRETGVNHFSGRRTLDQDAVHTFLARTRGQVPAQLHARRVPYNRDHYELLLRTILPPAARLGMTREAGSAKREAGGSVV